MTMGYGGMAGQAVGKALGGAAPDELWSKAATALKGELGENTYGSWLGPAAPREGPGGAPAGEPRAAPPPVAAPSADRRPEAAANSTRGSGLQDRFTFETFVPGPAND